MADVSGFTIEHPSGTSRLRDFPGGYRSDKSNLRNVWEQEHYWDTGSAGSAGAHKEGSGRVKTVSGVVPSVGTNAGELSIDQQTGRLWYSGGDIVDAEPLSQGTAFRIVVVGPNSLDTGSAWVMSFQSTTPDGTRVTWHHDDFPGYTLTPFIFFSHATARGGTTGDIFWPYCDEADASGATFTSQFVRLGSSSMTTDEPGGTLHILSIGTMPRSLFS